MARVIKTTFQLRRGLKNDWETINPLLAYGEPGFEVDTNKLKIGNGLEEWNDLEYLTGDSSTSGADWDAEEGQPGYIANKPFYSEYETMSGVMNLEYAGADYYQGSGEVYYYYNYLDTTATTPLSSEAIAITKKIVETVPEQITISFPSGDVSLSYNEEGSTPSDGHFVYTSDNKTSVIAYLTYQDFDGDVYAEFDLAIDASIISDYIPDYAGDPNSPAPFGNISIGFSEENFVKIDQKYVPNADWNASAAEDGYVKNRPFYEGAEVIKYDDTPVSFSLTGSDLSPGPGSGVYKISTGLGGDDLGQYILEWDSSPYVDTGYARVTIDGVVINLKHWSEITLPGATKAAQFTDSETEPTFFLVGALNSATRRLLPVTYIMSGGIDIPLDNTPIVIELVTTVIHKIDKKYLPEPVILYGNQTYGRNIYRTQADYNSNINPITATAFVSEKYYDAFLENRLFIVDDGIDPIPYEGLHRSASLVVKISLNSNNDDIVLNSIWYCESASSSESLSEE